MRKETREKISKSIIKKIKSGKSNQFGHIRKISHTSAKCENLYGLIDFIMLKSSFEKKACVILDEDPNCISYCYEQIEVPYIQSDGNEILYYPDFLVKYNDGTKKIIEAKPIKIMEKIKENRIKQKATIEFCKKNNFQYEFWNEKNMDIYEAYLTYDDNYYLTYEEFTNVVRSMNISSSNDYRRRYKEDPKLPPNPYLIYPNFKDWFDVLNKEKKDFYKTYKEAYDAIRTLKIKSIKEYSRRYKEDPKLHCSPNEYYSDNGWEGWALFLDKKSKYYSFQELKEILLLKDIKRKEDYLVFSSSDNLAPSHPERVYKEDWKGWTYFLNKK